MGLFDAPCEYCGVVTSPGTLCCDAMTEQVLNTSNAIAGLFGEGFRVTRDDVEDERD